jgi:hypothetical protein
MGNVVAALRLLSLMAIIASNAAPPAPAQETKVEPLALAVADFDYTDTSGEARDQQEAHAAQLEQFVQSVRDELAQGDAYRIVPLSCPNTPCTARSTDPATLIKAAQDSGARLLLYGGIQKMSTLIQYGKAQVVDLETDRLVFDKNISFRGDDDAAWDHAAEFLARELKKAELAK